MNFIKVTMIGGVVFLVPIAVLVIILGKIVNVLARLATPLTAWFPMDRVIGFAIADLLAVAVIVVVCFMAGLVARSSVVVRYINSL